MKTNLLLPAALFIGTLAITGSHGQTPVSPVPQGKVEEPLGLQCIVSLDPQASWAAQPGGDRKSAGFEADGTARGSLILLSEHWCVLKDGSSENWIPRDKILMIRVSK